VVQSGTLRTFREERNQAAGGDAEPDHRDRERQAGRDHGAERDQEDDRGTQEADPLGAGRALGGVDRVAASLISRPSPLLRLAAAISFSPSDL